MVQRFSFFDCSVYLVEITLKEELLEDVDELGERREAALEVLDQLGRLDAVEQVERDVHLDVRQPVRQLDDRDLQKFKDFFYWSKLLRRRISLGRKRETGAFIIFVARRKARQMTFSLFCHIAKLSTF